MGSVAQCQLPSNGQNQHYDDVYQRLENGRENKFKEIQKKNKI